MSAYFQMGHDTENLVGENDLNEFNGIILSPLNRTPQKLRGDIEKFRDKGQYDIILDSQLYFPRSRRENLTKHPYFPSDLDTADISSASWWKNINLSLSQYVKKLKVNAVTSPVIHPRNWSDDYYAICANTSNNLFEQLKDTGIRILTTTMVNLHELSDENKVLRIASILSDIDTNGFYLIFSSEIEPRREFHSENELLGAMILIRELKNTGLETLISHCSSDLLLFKSAGATNCATGKFFNLRRFTKSRWDEPSSGGGILPYWFEHSLFAFLREADLLRLRREGSTNLIKQGFSNNYWADAILDHFEKNSKKVWVALSWRQYLSWFGKTELFLSNSNTVFTVKKWLKIAEENWLQLEDNDILFDETQNDGKWIRPWRQALNDFLKKY